MKQDRKIVRMNPILRKVLAEYLAENHIAFAQGGHDASQFVFPPSSPHHARMSILKASDLAQFTRNDPRMATIGCRTIR